METNNFEEETGVRKKREGKTSRRISVFGYFVFVFCHFFYVLSFFFFLAFIFVCIFFFSRIFV